MARSLKVVDLFAGCGGLSLGLEFAGFQPVFVNELHPDAMETYLLNRESAFPHLREAGFHIHDVKQMVSDAGYLPALRMRLKADHGIDDGELDLVVGGPPCQGFSGIGHRRSYSVDKEQLPSNHLYQDMAAVVHRLKPRAFLFENVRGLLNARWTSSGAKGEIFEDVLRTFRGIPEYRVAFSLVRAKDYGVPQNRPRVLVVGMRNDTIVPNERPDEADAVDRGFLPSDGVRSPNIIELLGDLVDPNYCNGGSTERYPHFAESEIAKWLRTDRSGRIAEKGALVTEHDYSKHSATVVAKFKAMHANGGKIPDEFRTKKFAQRLLPEQWGIAGPTITACSLADDYVHFSQPRSLTVREWARLQTFPDWYQFSGKRTTGGIRRAGNPREGIFTRELPKYTQIGNAVPVTLACVIGNHLADILSRG